MELVPIIYNSLLVVFSLLSLVIVGSLICSKIGFCGENKGTRARGKNRKVKMNTSPRTKPVIKRESLNKKEVVFRSSQPKIERKLIDNKKVRVISRAEKRKKENAQNFVVNNDSRYSIVNNAPTERRSRRDLYHKFSKMSIEYSQSA